MDVKSRILNDLKAVSSSIGKIATPDEYFAQSRFTREQVFDTFGGYIQLLHAAGFQPEPQKKSKFKYKETKMHSINIHEIDLDEIFHKAGNPPSLKMIGQTDTHLKYADHAALRVFFKMAYDWKPHIWLIEGDFVDAEGITHWPNTSLEPRRFMPEVNEAEAFLRYIKFICPSVVSWLYMEGNHEDWINQALAAKLPELYDGMAEARPDIVPNLQNLLRLEQHGIQLFPVNHFLKIGQSYWTHGLYTGDNHPKKHLDVIKDNIYYGHVHDRKLYQAFSIRGIVEAGSAGCLCRLDGKFMRGKPTNWQHGFDMVEFFRDGSYTRYTPHIVNGRLSYNGKVYSAI